MNMNLKHDAAFCLREDCDICAGLVKLAQHIPCSTEKPPQLSEFCPTCHKQWVSGSLISENRFDPYEALDTIVESFEDEGGPPGSVLIPWNIASLISDQVHALRAYITGMER